MEAIDREGGFSIVEAVIAMFLLAVLSLALLPLLMTAITTSSSSTNSISANQLANSQLAVIRSQFSDSNDNSCAAVTSKQATGVAGASGSGLGADIVVSACPATYPGTVTVTVTAYRTAKPTLKLVTLPSKILVTKP